MQEFSTFDMVIVGISIVLGLKGLLKGFIKEVLGLVGIIGGIFVASRMSNQVGDMIKPIIGIQSEATLSLIGFIATLIGFWIIIYLIASILSKITDMSGLGALNRFLGFIFGTGKIFLIISIIVYALYQIQSFKSTLDEKFGNSLVFPYLVKTGGYIIKLDTSSFNIKTEKTTVETPSNLSLEKPNQEIKTEEVKDENNTTKQLKEVTNTLGQKVKETTSQAIETVKDTATQVIKDSIEASQNK